MRVKLLFMGFESCWKAEKDTQKDLLLASLSFILRRTFHRASNLLHLMPKHARKNKFNFDEFDSWYEIL